MASGNEIIVSADPKGHFEECLVSGTPKPGTCMELLPAQTTVDTSTTPGGFPIAATSRRFTYRAKSLTAGSKGPVCVLLPDHLQGKTAADAYVTLTRGFLYWPIAGEEMNMLVADVAGTGDDVAVGDLMGIDAAGKLHANSSYTSAPFAALEPVTDPTADYLLFVKYLGNNA